MSKIHLPFIETFLGRKYFCGRKIVIKNVYDKKKFDKNSFIRKLKLGRKTLMSTKNKKSNYDKTLKLKLCRSSTTLVFTRLINYN